MSDFIHKIKAAADIIDVVGERIQIKRKMGKYIACCPFHQEKTPSFYIDPRGTYHCFGCGAHGDVIDFVQHHDHLSAGEAMMQLAEKYHIEPDKKDGDFRTSNVAAARKVAMACLQDTAKAYASTLHAYPAALDYLRNKRGYSDATIEEWGLGYCPHMEATNLEAQRAAGLLNNRNYHLMGNRVVFPIADHTGKVVAFGGRVLEWKKGDSAPKYLNSPETDVYKKGEHLFGLHRAKQAITRSRKVVVVEGYTDVISMHQAGICNVVATCGTALTERQLQLLARWADCVVFMRDADAAGQKATERDIRLALDAGLEVQVCMLEDGQDPDSISRLYAGDALTQYIDDHTSDFVTWMISYLAEWLQGSPEQFAQAVADIAKALALVPNGMARRKYAMQAAGMLDVRLSDLAEYCDLDTDEDEGLANMAGVDVVAPNVHETGTVFLTTCVEQAAASKNTLLVTAVPGSAKQLVAKLGKHTKYTIKDDKALLASHKDGVECNLIGLANAIYQEGGSVFICSQLEGFHESVSEDGFAAYEDSISYFLGLQMINANAQEKRAMGDAVVRLMRALPDMVAEMKAKELCKVVGISTTAVKKEIKKQEKEVQKKLVSKESGMYLDELPAYIQQDPERMAAYNHYGFFEGEMNGKKVCYYFRQSGGSGYHKVCGFHIDPLVHIYHDVSENNKRIVKITSYHPKLRRVTSEYLEIQSSAFVSFQLFERVLFEKGAYIISNGKPENLKKIIESMLHDFKKCYELHILGYQPEGFYAWANCIWDYNAEELRSFDNLGLVEHKDKMYYSPSFSEMFTAHRAETDKYANDRFFSYKERPDACSWDRWASLMNEVYKDNNNGQWAILYCIMAAYRSDIFAIDKLFTALFFIGSTDSGKTQIGQSIQAPFAQGAPSFNLNSGTDAAFFTLMERFRDRPVLFEEYNDVTISDTKFQGLKAALYDGEGKQKRKSASTTELDISQVNAAAVLMGQEAPEKDDGALMNRVVLLPVSKKPAYTTREQEVFQELKDNEREGLSNIALAIVQQRTKVMARFKTVLRETTKELHKEMEGMTAQGRVINTVGLFLTMAKVWTEQCPHLPLGFTPEQFKMTAIKKIKEQSEELQQGSRISSFFTAIETLVNKEAIITGREFDIRMVKNVLKLKDGEAYFTDPTKVLMLRLSTLQPLYAREVGATNCVQLNALKTYLNNEPGFLGQSKQRFKWVEWDTVPYQDNDGNTLWRKEMRTMEANSTWCFCLEYDSIADRYDVNLASRIREDGGGPEPQEQEELEECPW